VSIGDDVAIHNLLFCANQHISNSVLILGVNEISALKGASFGMGDNAIDLVNENGGRAILPYPGMTFTDAYIWAKFRGDKELLDQLAEMTRAACTDIRPETGVVAERSVIVNAKAIRDAIIGPHAVVDGAELIDDSTILSDASEPTFIGPAVQIRKSIIGCGNKIDSAAQLSSVMTGTAVSLSKAARVEHSVIGDCAQIACCEIANSLIMPMHAQHHNNSFLIAAALGGQSNVAAGATIGSNHNSRRNDGEIWAKRGFWPGLCVSLRHNSRFASFTMIAKGA
jgi:carbonic anhydrase/acetyltransferase-like protein (isoleucine patch superfamily)